MYKQAQRFCRIPCCSGGPVYDWEMFVDTYGSDKIRVKLVSSAVVGRILKKNKIEFYFLSVPQGNVVVMLRVVSSFGRWGSVIFSIRFQGCSCCRCLKYPEGLGIRSIHAEKKSTHSPHTQIPKKSAERIVEEKRARRKEEGKKEIERWKDHHMANQVFTESEHKKKIGKMKTMG